MNKGKNSCLPIAVIYVGDCERRRSDFLDEGERRLVVRKDDASNANSGLDRRFDVSEAKGVLASVRMQRTEQGQKDGEKKVMDNETEDGG